MNEKRLQRTLALAFILIITSLCIVTATGNSVTYDTVDDFYSYDSSAPLGATIKYVETTEWYQHYEVSFKSEGDTVYAHYFVPVGNGLKPRPCIVGYHAAFTAEDQFWPSAEHLVKRGFIVLAPSLPHHHRRAKIAQIAEGQGFILGSPESVRDNMRRAVIDTRRAVDWLLTRPEVDHSRISVAGASLGGIVSSIAFKVDKRLRSAALISTGSGLAGVINSGSRKEVAVYRDVLNAGLLGWDDYAEVMKPTEPASLSDTSSRPVFMLNGSKDDLMDVSEALSHFKSYKQAEQVWCDSGHYVPAFASQFFVGDFFTRTIGDTTASASFYARPGFTFTETLREPVPGSDRLWADVSVEFGDSTYAHRFGIPLINRVTPVIISSASTYKAVGRLMESVPALVYVTEDDSPEQLQAALVYASSLGLGDGLSVFHISPSEQGFRLIALSAAYVELSRTVEAADAESLMQMQTAALVADYLNEWALGRMLSSSVNAAKLPPIPTLPKASAERFKWIATPTR